MIVDALVAAEPFYRIQGSGGKQLKLSECIGDMEAYSWLKDSLLDEIARSAVSPRDDVQYFASKSHTCKCHAAKEDILCSYMHCS